MYWLLLILQDMPKPRAPKDILWYIACGGDTAVMVHFENTFVANPAVVGSGRLWGLTWSGEGHTEAVIRGHTNTHGHAHVLQYFHPFLKSSDVVSLLPLLFRVTCREREGGGGGGGKGVEIKHIEEENWRERGCGKTLGAEPGSV